MTEAREQTGVGARLREKRRAAGCSIGELAERAGVSAGMISQVERGLSNPSLRILERLRNALGVPLSDLLEDPAPARAIEVLDFVRRADARPAFNVGPAPLFKHMLSPRSVGNLMFMTIEFPAFAASDDMQETPGEKAGMVMSGRFRLTVDGVEAELNEGDSFQFDSAKPHSIRNDMSTPSSLLWIIAQSGPIHQL
ncbi:helix-turn-helix domain-containing protein [Martelella soudanensis]|uniref:helix-turn-helix domain-containing protein n=1 Tax=Martelella sp. NC18 TaxID=2740297 RepID=UPI0015DFD8D2|nr:XRE family transcriptional regulator [Martelella sp. NC18]